MLKTWRAGIRLSQAQAARHLGVSLDDYQALELLSDDAAAGMAWWNYIDEASRAHWLRRAGGTGVPAEAWAACKAWAAEMNNQPQQLPEANNAGANEDVSAPMLAWRRRKGFTQRQAAAQLGTTLSTYQQWETGVSRNTGQPIAPPRVALLAAAALEHGLKPIGDE